MNVLNSQIPAWHIYCSLTSEEPALLVSRLAQTVTVTVKSIFLRKVMNEASSIAL